MEKILEELYELNPNFRKHEKDLRKILQEIIAARPDIKLDREFVQQLKNELLEKAFALEKNTNQGSFFAIISNLLMRKGVLIIATFFLISGAIIGFDYLNLQKSWPETKNYLLSKVGKDQTVEAPSSPVLALFSAENSGTLSNMTGYKERKGSDGSGFRDAGEVMLKALDESVDFAEETSGAIGLTGGYRAADAAMSASPSVGGGRLDSAAISSSPVAKSANKIAQTEATLKGGQIDDNDKFAQYLEYVATAIQGAGYDIDLSQRYEIRLKDNQNKGVLGKKIAIRDNSGQNYLITTDTDGRTYFYPSVYTTEAKNKNDHRCNNVEPQPKMPAPCRGDICPLTEDFVVNNCDQVFRGVRFDPALQSCVSESTTACVNPYNFQDKQECEQVCLTQIAKKYPADFTVKIDNQEFSFAATDKEWDIKLDENVNNKDKLILDLAFIIDTTGSMSDQINKLKVTIESISEQVGALEVKPRIRFGMVIYRDHTDEYLTRIYDFTENLEEFKKTLNTVQADSGGDYPEDVNTALADALEQLSWSQGKNVAKLSFLIADAPPHMDYGQNYDYRTAMLRALEMGVKIFPLASSGLDNTEGEYIFRQIALITNAQYVFITNNNGGTDYHIEEQNYSVSALDALIVKLIGDELAKIE